MTRSAWAIRFLLILFLTAPSVSRADLAFGNYDRFQTRYGLVEVRGAHGNEQLFVNGQAVPGLRNWSITILGAWARQEAPYDYVMVSNHTGGNACEPPVNVLRVAEGQVLVSPLLGECVGPPFDIRLEADRIELDFASRDIWTSHEVWIWDGANVTVNAVQDAVAAPAGAGADVTRWIGQHSSSLLSDASERARFATILTQDQMDELARRLGPANAAVARGDWVFGSGCMAHNCGYAGARWGLRISDGAVAVAFVDRGAPSRLFGPYAQDPSFLAWLAETRL